MGDKNWMSAALIHISLKDAAHVHLYSARRERVGNGKRRRVALDGTMTPQVPRTCRVSLDKCVTEEPLLLFTSVIKVF